ncbi:MAG: FAD-dependent oxidoreductase [Bacilli bacterium]|nr:FAD-dependent oxidoreductase [Bacilli bacterium]
MKKYKVVIIGSGIAGMTSAIYLKRGGIEPLIIENSAPGGILNIIPSIENYPGYTKISGPDLAMNIYNQVKQLDIEILSKNIKSLDLENKTIDNEISFDYLIIATGRRHRLLNLENEDKLLGRGISTCALCDGNFYRDKEVIVVGGGSSALTESLYLAGICKKVTIIHRRNSFSAEEYLIDKVNNTQNIKIIYNANIIKYNTKDNIITSVNLDTEEEVQTDGIFLSIGSIPNSELFNVEKENNYIKVDNYYETNIKNIYAIGDVIKKEYYQLINASNEGMIVALNIINKI